MIYLVGEMSNGAAKLNDTFPRGWGRMYVERPINPFPSEPWALDNGVFRAWRNGLSYEEAFERFERQLERASEVAYGGSLPLFVVAPDLPADASSIFLSLDWLATWELERQEELDPYGWHYGTRNGILPIFLAVQDGMTPDQLEELVDPETDEPILAKFSGLFIGGSDAFKETASEWRELADRWNLELHYGRATQSRLKAAIEAGADSADSAHPIRLGGARWERFLDVADELGIGLERGAVA